MDLYIYLFVIITVSYTVIADDTNVGCDDGWVNANNNCYMFVNTRKVTWQQAEYECNRFDASLFYFYTPAELNWYKGIVSNFPSAAYWSALNDVAYGDGGIQKGTGKWKWGKYEYTNTSLITWNKSPANDGQSKCAGVNIRGKMSDVDCNSKQGFICNLEQADGGGCPLAWLPTPTDCYYVSNTSDPSELVTWSQAVAKCKQLNSGSHLLTIDDVNDQNFLSGELPYLTQSAYLHWTGLQNKGGNSWQWYNGAVFNQQFFQWSPQEPDNVGGIENCAVLRYNGKFSDRGCTIQQNYICQKSTQVVDSILNNGCGIWLRGGQKCYMFYTDPLSTWQHAQSLCQGMQGDLINVKNSDTKEWIRMQLEDPMNNRIYWTALNDIQKEGRYTWTDGTVLDSNTISWNQEPNDYKGQEDCAVIDSTGGYNDVTCSRHSAPICEIDNVGSCPTKGGKWVSRNADSGTGLDCYLFGNYGNRSVLMTKSEAAGYCKTLAISQTLIPQLLSVDTTQEKTFINQQIAGYANNVYGFWTSLTDAQSEGFWRYPGKTELVDSSLISWRGEPSSATPDTDCVTIIGGANLMVKKCSLKTGFICERPANTPWSSGCDRMRTSFGGAVGVLIAAHFIKSLLM